MCSLATCCEALPAHKAVSAIRRQLFALTPLTHCLALLGCWELHTISCSCTAVVTCLSPRSQPQLPDSCLIRSAADAPKMRCLQWVEKRRQTAATLVGCLFTVANQMHTLLHLLCSRQNLVLLALVPLHSSPTPLCGCLCPPCPAAHLLCILLGSAQARQC